MHCQWTKHEIRTPAMEIRSTQTHLRVAGELLGAFPRGLKQRCPHAPIARWTCSFPAPHTQYGLAHPGPLLTSRHAFSHQVN